MRPNQRWNPGRHGRARRLHPRVSCEFSSIETKNEADLLMHIAASKRTKHIGLAGADGGGSKKGYGYTAFQDRRSI